jgi:hypothetical protein
MAVTRDTVTIVVYRITGRQGLIDIPHRYCEECDLTVRLVQGVLDEIGESNVHLDVKPWLLYFWKPILRGGWHAPILTINGRIFSQGIVPNRTSLRNEIQWLRTGAGESVETHIGHYPNAE